MLLLSTATGYDYQFLSASSRSTRKVHNTELGGIDFEIDSPSEVTEYLDYDLDASATAALANMTNRGNSNSDSYLPTEDHSSLTLEEKDLWRKITSNAKSTILKGKNSNNRTNNRFNSNKHNNSSYENIKDPSYNAKPFTKVNLNELLNDLIVEINESKDNTVAT